MSETTPPVLACVVLIGGDMMQDAAEIQIVSTPGSATGKQRCLIILTDSLEICIIKYVPHVE